MCLDKVLASRIYLALVLRRDVLLLALRLLFALPLLGLLGRCYLVELALDIR